MSNRKVTIIGAGAVGSATAYTLAVRGTAQEVVLLDINKQKAEAEALDIEHGSLFFGATNVVGTDDYSAITGSKLVIITSGARQHPGQSRIELAGATIEIMKSILPRALEHAPDAFYLIVANPVDIVTYACQKISGLPCSQLFGSGTVLDSSRLRTKLAEVTGANVRNVHAYIAGEHGDSEIVLWSSAIIGGVPVTQWTPLPGRPELTEELRKKIHQDVVSAAYKVIEGKGATNYAVALACDNITRAVLNDEGRIMPISTKIHGIDGLDDVCLSLPFMVGSKGVSNQIDTVLNTDELDGLRKSATTLRATLEQFGY
jgi:L-lactate dehydrogenase